VKVPFLDLPAQAVTLGSALRDALDDVLRSQRFILGPVVEQFEQAMARYCGVPHAIGVGSGTDALVLALQALGVGPGGIVVTTPLSFFATASAIARLGARPLFVDIDPETFNLDPTKVEEALERHRDHIVGIVPVHLFGRLAPMDELLATADRFGVWVVEDAAQAVGARTPMAMAGAFGRAGCLSFYPTKNLGGIGDGGMILTADRALATALRRERNQGIAAPHEHVALGTCSRLDALNAAALHVKLAHLEAWNARRREIAGQYATGLREAGLAGAPRAPLMLPASAGEAHVYHQYVVRAADRDALGKSLADQGVATQVYYPTPLPRQPALATFALTPMPLPETERAAREVLALPVYPELSDEQIRHVIDACRRFYRGA